MKVEPRFFHYGYNKDSLPTSIAVLDIGCGSGQPIAACLAGWGHRCCSRAVLPPG
jgi:SAM-dependent methyltransferase